MTVNIPDVNVVSGSIVVSNADYTLYCYPHGSTKGEDITYTKKMRLKPGFNFLLAVGKNNYFGYSQLSVESYVNPINCNIKLKKSTFGIEQYDSGQLHLTYSGFEQKPIVLLSSQSNEPISQKYDGWSISYPENEEITYSFDEYMTYNYEYANNIDVGIASCTVKSTHLENTTPKTLTFTIDRLSMLSTTIDGINTKYVLSGNALGSSSIPVEPTPVVKYNSKIFSANDGYVVSYLSNSWIGKASLTIEGVNNLCAYATREFDIVGNMKDANATYEDSIQFDGQDHKQIPSNVTLFNKALEKDVNYSISYPNIDFVSPGNKIFNLDGLESGFCFNTQEFIYIIFEYLEKCTITGIDKIYKYTGQEIKPIPNVQYEYLNKVTGKNVTMNLIENIDYELCYYDNPNYVNPNAGDMTSAGKKYVCVQGGLAPYWRSSSKYGIRFEYTVYDESYTVIEKHDNTIMVINNAILNRSDIGINDIDKSLKKVSIGRNVVKLENNIFANCKQLEEVDLSNCSSSLELSEGCFDGCVALNKIIFPGAI